MEEMEDVMKPDASFCPQFYFRERFDSRVREHPLLRY